jgi:1,4-dihydroxy-2-naphthoyl-CoA hydrolase
MTLQQLLEQTANSELLKFLGVEIVEVVPGERVVLTMPVTPRVHQYIGIMNGGVSLLLSETAASIGAVASTDLTKSTPVGIEINANHLRPISKGTLTAAAKPIYHGATLSVWQVELTNERGKLVCLSRCTLAHKKGAAFPDAAS